VGVAIPRFTRDPSARESTSKDPVKAKALLGVVHVRFGFDRADLDEGAEKALLAVLKELRENPGLTVALEGATDSMGARDYNVQLSQRRVDAVRRFLLAKGVDSPRVIHSTALGPLRDEKIPDEQKRRVAVKLMKAD
jgi:OOP family OmpA-OmpF porin